MPSIAGTIATHWRTALLTAALLPISRWQKICIKNTALRNSEKGEGVLSCWIVLERNEISLHTQAGFDADLAKPREALRTQMGGLSRTDSNLSIISVTHVSDFQVRP